MRILSLSIGTLGYLDGYVSSTTKCYELLGSRHGATTINLSTRELCKFGKDTQYPDRSSYGNLCCLRRGTGHFIQPDDYQWFLDCLAGMEFDIIHNLNGVSLEFTSILKSLYEVPCVMTFEQAGLQAGYALDNSSTQIVNPRLHERWQKTKQMADGIISWHVNDIPRLQHLGAKTAQAYHVKYGLTPAGSAETLKKKQRKRNQAAYVGSIIANKSHWKRCWELEHLIPILLNHTPVEKFVICGRLVDQEAEKMIERLLSQYPLQVEYCFFPNDKKSSEKIIAESFFVYTPIGSNQIGSVPVECWAFGTPILGTAANFITHGWDGIKAEGLHEVPRVINSLYENPCLYERLSKNGELRFKQEFSIKTMADSYYSVFKDVINKFEGYML